MSTNNPRPTKAQRNASAREKAAQLRASQEAAQKRKSTMVKIGVLVAVVVVIALVVTLIVRNNNTKISDTGATPQGATAAGGILVTSSDSVGTKTVDSVDVTSLTAPTEQLDAAKPRDLIVADKGDPINITMYVDANCVHCADFEATYGDQIDNWLASGDVTVEYRNVGYLDGGSATNYSSRGANALACVADVSPTAYMKFVKALWGHYPEGEMKNAELAQMAIDNGADASVKDCITSDKFRPFVQYATTAGQYDGVKGTPSIFIQGKELALGTDDFPTKVEEAIKANK
ncbi:DsbA family protein [Glutamicibacter sp.]|uniref:DsbA family protein n=1 Tax=Glutamicibacter sp. TaxID=1931995 RepID=UPI002FE3575F